MFENVIGYDYVKEELSTIIGWYKDERLLNDQKVRLPKGIIFFGEPGNGKTLLVRELINAFDTNSYIIQGEGNEPEREIKEVYEKARKNQFSLVLIDEIDLLIDKDKKILRILQDELDGINQDGGRVLTIATTNYIYDIPDALRRRGRFDREIKIDRPDIKTRKELIKKLVDELGIDDSKIQYDFIAEMSHHRSCSDLISICNDMALRNYGGPISNYDFLRSMDVCDGNLRYSIENSKRFDRTIAIHEIGHALLTLKYSDNYNLLMTNYSKEGGYTSSCPAEGSTPSVESERQNIEITLAGMICEKLFVGYETVGAENDLEKVRNLANYLVNRYGFFGTTNVLKRYNQYSRMETEKTRLRNEELSNKIIKKCERNTIRFLKDKGIIVSKLAELMQEKGFLVKEDFINVITSNNMGKQFRIAN